MTADAQDCVEGEIRGHHGTNGYEETVETEVKGVKSRQADIFNSWGGGTNDEKNFEADGVEQCAVVLLTCKNWSENILLRFTKRIYAQQITAITLHMMSCW